jgi:hypothetical protein
MVFTLVAMFIWFSLASLLYWVLGRRKTPVEVANYASVFVPVSGRGHR